MFYLVHIIHYIKILTSFFIPGVCVWNTVARIVFIRNSSFFHAKQTFTSNSQFLFREEDKLLQKKEEMKVENDWENSTFNLASKTSSLWWFLLLFFLLCLFDFTGSQRLENTKVINKQWSITLRVLYMLSGSQSSVFERGGVHLYGLAEGTKYSTKHMCAQQILAR